MKLEILVPIATYPDGNTANLARHVAAVAGHLDADVHALTIITNFPPLSSALGNLVIDVPAMISEARERCRERAAAVVDALSTQVKAVGVRTTKIDCLQSASGDIVATFARYHDLVLVGLGKDDAATRAIAEAAIFGSGRPTLVIPEALSAVALEHVMIAWDGSRVATRAVSDAREFLRRAQSVTIASVTDEKSLPHDDPGKRLGEYLSRHDIKATVSLVQSRRRPIGQTLQEEATEIGAGLIVMGGFGHSRMRDFVLGGATSGILKDLRLPALLSH
jgi:nucleotide-binding universal stress UspA family protein